MPERKVAQLGVRLEDADHTDEEDSREEGLVAEGDCERGDVGEDVQLEDADEEAAEVVKHLDKEVPPEPNVGRQVGIG